jgi:RND family efflux transporter MFP subunit
MGKFIKILITIIIIVLIAVGGIRLLKMRKAQLANLPTPQHPVYTVKGAIVQKGVVLEKNKFLGKIVPENEVNVSTKFAGNIEKVYVNEGDKVKKGQLLAKLDDSNIQIAIQNLKINKEALQNQLKSLEAQLESAKSNYEFVKTNFERDKKLFEGKAISEIQFLQSKTQLDTAKAKIDSIKANIEALKNKISSIDKQVELKKSDLKYLDIYSSVNGVVEKVFLREGNLAVPGKPILRLQSSKYKILINFPKDYLGLIKVGTLATVDFHGVIKKLRIDNIYPSADKNSLAIAEIYMNKLPENTPSNSFVNVVLINKKVEGLTVPNFAILHLTNGTFVLTNKEGEFIKIPVKVLAQDEKKAVIEGNIKEGAPVAVAMENKLRLLAMGKKGKILLKK